MYEYKIEKLYPISEDQLNYQASHKWELIAVINTKELNRIILQKTHWVAVPNFSKFLSHIFFGLPYSNEECEIYSGLLMQSTSTAIFSHTGTKKGTFMTTLKNNFLKNSASKCPFLILFFT